MMISNIRENGEPIGALPDGEMMFHHDMIHAEVPSKAHPALFGRNSLDRRQHAVRQRLRRLRHARSRDPQQAGRPRAPSTTTTTARCTKNDDKGTEAFAESTHPAFRTHEDTGRKAVYVNRLMTVGIEGMPQAEAEPLLEAVFDHAEKPEFVYEHVWRVGDLLLWDNRCSSHARRDFPSTERRLMLRTTVKGSVRPA